MNLLALYLVFSFFWLMNFLAHIYLSGDNDFIKIGNFIADGIHGKNFSGIHPEIQKGIILHRHIDTFTDSHSIFKQSTKKLHTEYGHYSGVIIDIFYDHFLAKNWVNYSSISLADFTSDFYQLLEKNLHLTPDKTKRMFPYMVSQNWLYAYRSFEGISQILYQMDSRTGFKSKMQFAPKELQAFYPEFESEFTLFFKELQSHVNQQIPKL